MTSFLELADRIEKQPVTPDWAAQLHPPEKRAHYDFVVLKVREIERDMIVTALRGADALRSLAQP